MTNPDTSPDRQPLMDEFGITDEDIERRKAWLDLTAKDFQRLASLNALFKEWAGPIVEELYAHVLSFEETKEFLRDEDILWRVKEQQRQYCVSLTQGKYDREYVEQRLKIGATHERLGVDVKWYLGALTLYSALITRRISATFAHDPSYALSCARSVQKLLTFDATLAIETFIHEREKTISRQRDELATSDRQWRTILDSVADAIAVAVANQRVYVNKAYLALFGLTSVSQALGRPLTDGIFPEDQAMVLSRALARQQGEGVPAVYEYRIQRPDGEIRVVETSAVRFTFTGAPASLAVIRDVTRRNQSERQLAQRVKELSALNQLFQEYLAQRFLVAEAYQTVLQRLNQLPASVRENPGVRAIVDWARQQPLPDLSQGSIPKL